MRTPQYQKASSSRPFSKDISRDRTWIEVRIDAMVHSLLGVYSGSLEKALLAQKPLFIYTLMLIKQLQLLSLIALPQVSQAIFKSNIQFFNIFNFIKQKVTKILIFINFQFFSNLTNFLTFG